MIKGQFTGNIPIVKVEVTSQHRVQTPLVVLDTGFTGDLQLTPEMAAELGLEMKALVNARTADGKIITVPITTAYASLEGIVNNVEILISDSFPLMGISFLTKFGYKAMVDCKNRTVELEKSL